MEKYTIVIPITMNYFGIMRIHLAKIIKDMLPPPQKRHFFINQQLWNVKLSVMKKSWKLSLKLEKMIFLSPMNIKLKSKNSKHIPSLNMLVFQPTLITQMRMLLKNQLT